MLLKAGSGKSLIHEKFFREKIFVSGDAGVANGQTAVSSMPA